MNDPITDGEIRRRERAAFTAGVATAIAGHGRSDRATHACTFCDQERDKHYPVLMMNRPRVVPDPDRGQWKFEDGRFFYRCAPFGGMGLGGILGHESAEWKPSSGLMAADVGKATEEFTPQSLEFAARRAQVMRELMLAPTEIVEAP